MMMLIYTAMKKIIHYDDFTNLRRDTVPDRINSSVMGNYS